MNLLDPTTAYVLLVIFGAVAIGVHAYSLYGQRIVDPAEDRSDDPLATLSLLVVVGRIAFQRGFLFYLGAFEFLYLVTASSSLILELSLTAIGQSDNVGALSTKGGELNPLFPILASTVVITASQFRPFSDVERAVRVIAHYRVAGLPRNLFEVQERIRGSSMEALESGGRRQYAASAAGVHGNSEPRGFRILQQARDQAAEVVKKMPPEIEVLLDKASMETSLVRVRCLYEWTLGYDGEQIWVDADASSISMLFASLGSEYLAHHERIAGLHRDRFGPAKGNAQSVEDLRRRWMTASTGARKLERSLTIVLALLLLNKPNVGLGNYPLLRELRKRVFERDGHAGDQQMDIVGMSLISGSFLALLCTMSYLAIEKGFRDLWVNRTLQLGPLLGEKAPFAVEEGWFRRSVATLVELFDGRFDDALFETLDLALIFAVSAVVALLIRRTRMEQRQWRRVDGQLPPVGSYLYVGFMAYLFSTLAFLFYRFLVLNLVQPLQSDSPVFDSESLRDFGAYLPEIAAVPLTAFLCVWFVCSTVDQETWRKGRYAHGALRFAAGCAALNFSQRWFRGAFVTETDPVAAFMVPLLVFGLLFGTFIRTYERGASPLSVNHRAVEPVLRKAQRSLLAWIVKTWKTFRKDPEGTERSARRRGEVGGDGSGRGNGRQDRGRRVDGGSESVG